MGAWDATVFGNDEAADFSGLIGDLHDRNEIVSALVEALNKAVLANGYLESWDASEALAAAALVAGWNNPVLLTDNSYAPDAWPPAGATAPAELRVLAEQAIARVLDPAENELYEQWTEAGEWELLTADIDRYRKVLGTG